MAKNSNILINKINLKAQRGQAILALLAIVAIALSAAFYNFFKPTSLTFDRYKITAAALAEAREALIGYAASENNRPGSLPCPDLVTDISNNRPNDGIADVYAGSECPGYVGGSNVYIGRLPWQTLGLRDLRDGNGERLWYAVSREFAKNPTCWPNCPLNSDTLGQLTITGIAPSSYVIAIIFSPGAILGTQARSSAGENTASNYLENENADGSNATFTTQSPSITFNDSLIVITNSNLMPAVEQRVAREMISYLNNYRANTGVYPWADLGDGNSNSALYTAAYNRNRFPCRIAAPINWGSGGTPTLPNWLTNGCLPTAGNPITGWSAVIYYGVARNRLQGAGAGCTTCDASSISITNLTNSIATQCTSGSSPVCTPSVIASGNADLVLLTSGGYSGIGSRSWSHSAWSTISGYFVDSNTTVSNENRDNDDDDYYVPSATDINRARMFIVR